MKKIIILLVCLVFIFAGCKQLSTPPNTTQSSTVLDDPESNTTLSSQDQTDDSITIVDNKKVFDNGAFTLSVPADWKCMEVNGEDGSSYSFQHPTLGEKCQFFLYRTALDVSRPYTEDQCLTHLSQSGYENAKISYYEREDVNGYGCRKLVFSYSLDNTQFIGIHYIDIIWSDFSIYDFRITYPASEQETFEPVFNSILNSIKLKTPIEDETDNPYALHEITDERITIVEGKKVFDNTAITLSVPSDWKCMEVNGEDGSSYFFRHPTLGEKCQISFGITGAVYLVERTEAEYLAYLSHSMKDVKITTFEKDKINGYTCTKVVFSYSLDDTEFVGIHYENLVEDVRLYDFSITYPASEQKTFEPVFNSILDSIKFTPESPYKNVLDSLKAKQKDLCYSIKDIDGNDVDDLVILENTKISVYTFDKSVNLVGVHDFLTGTARFFYSDKNNYPGIFYYTVGGGVNHYGYLTIQDGKLLFKDLWEETYATNLPGSTNGIKELSTDKELISESKALFEKNCDIVFKALK